MTPWARLPKLAGSQDEEADHAVAAARAASAKYYRELLQFGLTAVLSRMQADRAEKRHSPPLIDDRPLYGLELVRHYFM